MVLYDSFLTECNEYAIENNDMDLLWRNLKLLTSARKVIYTDKKLLRKH